MEGVDGLACRPRLLVVVTLMHEDAVRLEMNYCVRRRTDAVAALSTYTHANGPRRKRLHLARVFGL